jgi:VanZ family protein
MVFVTWSSLASFSDADLPDFDIPHIDKLVHFTFYFVAMILGIMTMNQNVPVHWSFRKAAIILLITMVFFGIIIEVIQYYFTSDRMGDPYDALANSLGALCGVLAMKFVIQRTKGLKWKQ